MMEYEKKIIITAREYNHLLLFAFSKGTSKIQVNYYYDRDDYTWSALGVTCRVRYNNGQYIATVKEHHSGGLECSKESAWPVLDAFDGTPFRDMDVQYQGCLQTLRTSISPWEGVKLFLDKNKYLDVVDYELEIEYDPETEERAEKELQRLSQLCLQVRCEQYQPLNERVGLGKSKSERFFERKTKLFR